MKPLACLALSFFLPLSVIAKTVDVYLGTSADGIYHATLNAEKGKLSKPTLAAEIKRPGFLTWNADKSRLYAVAFQETPVVAAYAVNDDASLKLLNTTPIGDGGGCHLAVHPTGKFLITAQYGGGSTAVFPIAEDGSVKERSQLIKHQGGSKVNERRQSKPHPHWTGFSPDGRFAFVPDLGTDQIVIYAVEGAVLKPHGFVNTIPGGGPRHMRFSIDGNFIHLLNEMDVSVTTFAYNAEKGTATRLHVTQALSKEVKAKEAFLSSSEILVHPNGKFVYSGNRGNDSITVYHADKATGKLEVIEVEPVRGAWPRNINLHGKWMLAAGAHSNTLAIFAIHPETGELAFQRNGVVNLPSPICILFKD